jgi:hypothetical protein
MMRTLGNFRPGKQESFVTSNVMQGLLSPVDPKRVSSLCFSAPSSAAQALWK